jgi:hypothetical protein
MFVMLIIILESASLGVLLIWQKMESMLLIILYQKAI